MPDGSRTSSLTDNLRDTSHVESANPKWAIEWPVARQWGSIVLWLLASAAVYKLSFPDRSPAHSGLFILFIIYYMRWYQRVLEIPFWAADTLRVLHTSANDHHRERRQSVFKQERNRLPRFVVLIAAYKAQSSIRPVLQAIKHQDYPEDRYSVYVVTQQAENEEKRAGLRISKEMVLGAISSTKPVRRCTETDARILERIFEAAMIQNGVVVELSPWRSFVAARMCLGLSRRRIRAELARKLVRHCFGMRESGGAREQYAEAFDLLGLRVGRNLDRLISAADACLASSRRITDDFSLILGLGAEQPLFTDASNSLRMAISISRELLLVRLTLFLFARSTYSQLDSFVRSVESEMSVLKQSAPEMSGLQQLIEDTYNRERQTCPEAVDDAIRPLDAPDFHHICRVKVGGGKPESLNTAYRHIVDADRESLDSNTFFVVIDADSLMHASCLSTIACEILADSDRSSIRQIAPLSLSNFRGNNILGKLVCCLDTMGSTGKWAWNSRTQKRPDLPAGSGVVVPATLARLLEKTKGTPWDAQTITEDARMIISDYGLMDEGTSKTKFVPTFLFEAVPEGGGLLSTYRQYWVQRMRWASGGPDETIELLRAYGSRRLYDSAKKSGPISRLSLARRIAARYRQTRLLIDWVSDHLWWSYGYGLAPIFWTVLSMSVVLPRSFSVIGAIFLFSGPAMAIVLTFRKFNRFVPGGLGGIVLLQLYLSSILLGWFLSLPIMYAQIVYLVRGQKCFRTWTTTAKPRF